MKLLIIAAGAVALCVGPLVVASARAAAPDHGAAMYEPAEMTLALHRGAAGWKITAWTWTGPRPTPAS